VGAGSVFVVNQARYFVRLKNRNGRVAKVFSMEIADKSLEVLKVNSRTAARWYCVAPVLLMLVVVNQLDKTNIAVISADRSFLSEMALAGQPTRIGFLSTIFFLGYGLGLFAWGFVVDRLGPRRSAMLGVSGWALTTVWCAVTHSVNELYWARLILGLTEGCIWPVCNSYSGRWFPVQEHGRIQSTWVNGNQLGIALGLPVVTALISVGGWRMVFWALGVGSLLLLEPVIFFLAPDEPSASPYTNDEERRYILSHRAQRTENFGAHSPRLTSLMSNRAFWIVTLCHAGTVATLFGLVSWIPIYLTQARGLPFHALGSWVSLCYVIPIGVALGLGCYADRTRRPAMVGAETGAVVAAMVLVAVTVPNTVIAVLLLVAALAAPMIYGAMNASIMQRLAMPQQIGRATGIFVGAGNLIGGLAPAILGYLIGRFGGRYLAAFGFISAVNLVLMILYFLVDRKSLGSAEVFAG
jgi:sugar phosphate permease